MVPIWWRDKEDLVKKLQQLDWITRNCRCWSRPGEGSQPEIPPVHSINAYIPEMVYRLWKDMEYQRICQYSPNLYCKILKIRIVFYKYFYILSWMMLAFLCLGSQYSICSFGKLMKYKSLSAKCNYNFLPLQWNLSSILFPIFLSTQSRTFDIRTICPFFHPFGAPFMFNVQHLKILVWHNFQREKYDFIWA